MNETRGPYRGFMRQWAGEPFRAALGADDAHPVSQHLRICGPLVHRVPLVGTASFVFSGTSPSEWDQGFESPSLQRRVNCEPDFRTHPSVRAMTIRREGTRSHRRDERRRGLVAVHGLERKRAGGGCSSAGRRPMVSSARLSRYQTSPTIIRAGVLERWRPRASSRKRGEREGPMPIP